MSRKFLKRLKSRLTFWSFCKNGIAAQSGRAPSIGIGTKRMGLCLKDTAGRVESSISVCPGRF